MILWNFISYILIVASLWFIIMSLGRPLSTPAGRFTIIATGLWFAASWLLGVVL